MATSLPCPDGAGSINNTSAPEQMGSGGGPDVYVAPNLCVGAWSLTDESLCLNQENINQQGYVEETLSISGAPINIYRLLGIHEQGDGSLLSAGNVFTTAAFPGYPLSNINAGGPDGWRSSQIGSAVVTSGVAVGIDFGILRLSNGESAYSPPKPNLKPVAAIFLKQGNTSSTYARQVRVDIAEGDMIIGSPVFTGVGNGTLTDIILGPNATASTISAMAISSTEFLVVETPLFGPPTSLGLAVVGTRFSSIKADFIISAGATPFSIGDLFTIAIDFVWKRAGVFNLIQSANAIALNLQTSILARAVKVTPTMFTGSDSWEVLEFNPSDSAPTNINNIQDLFFGENRDRDYEKIPVTLKCQYSPTDSISDLSKFGLSILDQYSFTTSFSAMVRLLGRPVVTGDILELPMEMQYDQNLKPIRKFLEVTDTGWASEGFSPAWKPTVFRFSAQQALPSQETRDIFGTIDTQKYMVEDSILADGIGEQIDTTPLTTIEEIKKDASTKVPEIGSDDALSTLGQPIPIPTKTPPLNVKPGEPKAAVPSFKNSIYIEDGLPDNGEPYGEGYALPDVTSANDGDYFRLYYPSETKIAPRLYRFSAIKNRWIYKETDRRGDYSSHKPSVRKILQSDTKQGLKKKLT